MPLSFLLVLASLSMQAEGPMLPLSIGGRVERDADGAYRFGWPGTYFETRFRGSGLTLATDSATEHLRLLVDGQEKVVLREAGNAILSISGLPDAEHDVRIEKLTESQAGSARLLSLRALPGSTALAPIPRDRSIEFIGDSYTVGYGNRSPVRECTQDQVHDRTDTQVAFGPIVAKRYNADYRIHAYSGFGIVRNYNGANPDSSLPQIYDRVIPGETRRRPVDSGWTPQLIVINLGTNDFSTELHAGEKWSDQSALRSDYRSSYRSFLRKLMKEQPQARFILVGAKSFFAEVQQVAAMLTPSEREKVTTVAFDGLDLKGCDWHPSLADHHVLAAVVADAIGRTGLAWAPAAKPASHPSDQLQ